MIKKGYSYDSLVQQLKECIKENKTLTPEAIQELIRDAESEGYNKRVSGKEMANALSDFVNSGLSNQFDEFAETVTRDDRTLQQSMFRLFKQCLVKWSEDDKKDPRTDATKRQSRIMIEATKHETTPYI